jgi:hypothetical protein
MWCDKELEEKIKLRYYKDVINPNLEYQNYLSFLMSVNTKIKIVKIRTNFHELNLGIGQFLKCHGMKECVTFVTLRRLKMKNTFSYIVQPIPILDLIFKICFTLPTFLTS